MYPLYVSRLGVLIVLLAIGLPPGAAGQQSSSLQFLPLGPTSHSKVIAEYQPTDPGMSAEASLVLRARLRTPQNNSYNDGMPQTTLAELHRDSQGMFRGRFRLPPQVVYGVFTVEDSAGVRVDANGGAFWELLVHDPPTGQPLPQAVMQRFHDHMGRNVAAVLESARVLTTLYPDRADGWNALFAAEQWNAGSGAEGERAAHRTERIFALDSRMRERNDLSGDDLGAMRWAWLGVDDTISAYWRERLLREHPHHHFAVAETAQALNRVLRKDAPGRLLTELERLWSDLVVSAGTTDLGLGHSQLAGLGFGTARQAGTRGDKLRWLERVERLQQFAPAVGARIRPEQLLSDSDLRGEGLERLRQEAARLRMVRAEDRVLGATAVEQAAVDRVRLGQIFRAIGTDLVAQNNVSAGIDTLVLAADLNWDSRTLRTLAEASLQLGDTVESMKWLARWAADRANSTALLDSVRSRLGPRFHLDTWRGLVKESRVELLDRTMAMSVHQNLPRPLHLLAQDGTTNSIDMLRQDASATVIVFWSRFCTYSMRAMPDVQKLAQAMAGRGIRFLPVTNDAATPEFQKVVTEADLTMPLFHDVTGEVSRAFNTWGTPQFYVLDEQGRLRFANVGLSGVELHLNALLENR